MILILIYFKTMINSEDLNFYYMSKLDFYDENIWYHDDYTNINKHIKINNSHEISKTAAETELKTFSSFNKQFTAQFRLADLLTKSYICKECHWEFNFKNQLHHHLLI